MNFSPTATAQARNDPRTKTKHITIPLTELQADFLARTARRLGWSKATLAREALFRFTADLESNNGRAELSLLLSADVEQAR